MESELVTRNAQGRSSLDGSIDAPGNEGFIHFPVTLTKLCLPIPTANEWPLLLKPLYSRRPGGKIHGSSASPRIAPLAPVRMVDAQGANSFQRLTTSLNSHRLVRRLAGGKAGFLCRIGTTPFDSTLYFAPPVTQLG
jgi:hypothetical protein